MRFLKYPGFIIIIFFMLSGCCTTEDEYDITGNWNITIIAMELNRTFTITFSGTETSGRIILYGMNGIYETAGNSVTFSIRYWDREWGTVNETFTGQFNGEDLMSGTATFEFVDDRNTETGTWTATR